MRFGALIFNLYICLLAEAGEEMKVSALDGLEKPFYVALAVKGDVFYLVEPLSTLSTSPSITPL